MTPGSQQQKSPSVRRKKFQPRRFGEHKFHDRIHGVSVDELRIGDILIAREWSIHDADGSLQRSATCPSEATLLVLRDAEEWTAESLYQGLKVRPKIRKRDHVVYGCTNRVLAREAALVAEVLAGLDPDEQEGERPAPKSPVVVKDRGNLGAVALTFGRMKPRRGASQRIQKIYDVVYNGASPEGLRLISPEFIVTCYEVAAYAINLGRPDTAPIKAFGVHPWAVTGKALEALLMRPDTPFKLSGTFHGSLNQGEGSQGLKKMSDSKSPRRDHLRRVSKQQENGKEVSPDGGRHRAVTRPADQVAVPVRHKGLSVEERQRQRR